MLSRVMPLSRHTLTNCTTSWLLITSHTPSHASTKNLSSERSSTYKTESKSLRPARADWQHACQGKQHFLMKSMLPFYRSAEFCE